MGVKKKLFILNKQLKNESKSSQIKQKTDINQKNQNKKKKGKNTKNKKPLTFKKLFLAFGIILLIFIVGVFVMAYFINIDTHRTASPYSKIKQVKIKAKKKVAKVTGENKTKTKSKKLYSNIKSKISAQPATIKSESVTKISKLSQTSKEEVQEIDTITQKIKQKELKQQNIKKEYKKIYHCIVKNNDEVIYYVKDNKSNKLIPSYFIPNWDGKGFIIKKGEIFNIDATKIKEKNNIMLLKIQDKYIPTNSMQCKIQKVEAGR